MKKETSTSTMTSLERTTIAIAHGEPDRTPVDFMAAPEIWQRLADHLRPDPTPYDALSDWIEPMREALLSRLAIDCRVISYDMFVRYPENLLRPGERVDWWSTCQRSTPNRMWRRIDPEGRLRDVWGIEYQRVMRDASALEQIASFPLAGMERASDLKSFTWPEPDWWDFHAVPRLLEDLMKTSGPVHIRYRAGSVFEIAWQLCGMEKFLTDLLVEPSLPCSIMERLCEIQIEVMKRFLSRAGDRVKMVYYYDDVAATQSLLVSRDLWLRYIRPHHARLIETARSLGMKTMYHTDGAVEPLLEDFIDMGLDVLSPIQPEVAGFDDPRALKEKYGTRLSFHGGVSVTHLLPSGNPRQIQSAVKGLVGTLGRGGGYVLSSSHHIQTDTPIANVLAMYDTSLR
jgi:uroporphyrinogen decarboxylase